MEVVSLLHEIAVIIATIIAAIEYMFLINRITLLYNRVQKYSHYSKNKVFDVLFYVKMT